MPAKKPSTPTEEPDQEFRKRRTQSKTAGAAITAGKSAAETLAEYQSMRDFGATPEPSGDEAVADLGAPRFCVQLHHATQKHYDFRLEVEGALKSWAVPKGPSYSPKDKRLAMETEDHPLSYWDFEGVIPEGHYGAGPVLLWDAGTIEWVADPKHKTADPSEQYALGKMVFRLRGTKLNGEWTLVKTKFGGRENSWLLIKHRDATADEDQDIVTDAPNSIKSGLSMAEIAAAG